MVFLVFGNERKWADPLGQCKVKQEDPRSSGHYRHNRVCPRNAAMSKRKEAKGEKRASE